MECYSWKCCDTPLGPFLAWRKYLREIFTESADCTGTEVGKNKKSQIKNRRDVKVQLQRGERRERKIEFSFSENGKFLFFSEGEK